MPGTPDVTERGFRPVDSLGWISISDLLSYMDGHWSGLTTSQRIEFKTVLDAINNNRALTLVIIT